jgi:hypothetical protein
MNADNNNANPMVSYSDLPVEMYEEICQYLQPTDVMVLGKVNKNSYLASIRFLLPIYKACDFNFDAYDRYPLKVSMTRVAKNFGVMICKTTSDSKIKLFYKVDLYTMVKTQISQSRYITMLNPSN